jgi:hypothetical protein
VFQALFYIMVMKIAIEFWTVCTYASMLGSRAISSPTTIHGAGGWSWKNKDLHPEHIWLVQWRRKRRC